MPILKVTTIGWKQLGQKGKRRTYSHSKSGRNTSTTFCICNFERFFTFISESKKFEISHFSFAQQNFSIDY